MNPNPTFVIKNEKDLKELYESNFALLFNYGRKMGISSDLVEDAIQELFVSVWSKKEAFNKVTNQQAYLLRALRNNLIRKNSSAFQTEELSIESNQISEPENTGEETSVDIKSRLDNLPDRQRELLILKYYEGMDYEEIGQIMDMNYQSVRNLYSRAIKNLQSKLTTFILILFFCSEYITIFNDSW